MPVINGVYLKDFPALPSSVADANIIPIAISGNQIAYRTTVAGIVTDARVTSKLLTGLSVTGSTISATDTILQAFGKVQNQLNGKVSSVGLTMPSAFNVANSPITSSGTLAVTAAGVASQYIRGDGALADFPTTGGGGSSVSYYLNGSVSQGTFVGNTYYEMNKTPVIGTGTDFTIGADGYIAQFITDANDPASLLIPAGNWNVEMYFSASSNGGSPSFYVEVYKYNGTTFTLLGSSSATPEGITNGTAIDIYYTSVGIPETVLTITDRLAIRVYVTHSGRTITLHTEDNHLSEIVTTFSNGLTTLNGLTKQAQYFAVGSTGTDFAIVSSVDTHTFNIPSASATARGLITTGTQTIAGDKTLTGTLYISSSAPSVQLRASNFSVAGFVLANSAGTLHWTLETDIGAAGAQGEFRLKNQILNTNAINISTSNLVTLTGGLVGTTANFTGQLTLGSTITNGTYTYTLPSATGTLALTSDIHSAVTLSAIGSTANANGATLTGQVLNLQPASASFGGVVTTGTQTFAGDKTFTGNINASPTSGNAIQAITTTSTAIEVQSTTADGVQASSTTGAAISGNASGTSGRGVLGQASGTGGSAGNFTGSSNASYAVYANATGSSTTAFYGSANSASYPVQSLIQSGLGSIALFGNSGGTVATITNSGGLTLAGQLSLASTITNGTYTYTLPSATGTLALTSALSSYLPLSGGTLTGALSGTSATFSSTLSATGLTATSAYSYLYGLRISGNDTGNTIYQATGALGISTGGSSITFAPNLSTALTLASTGAATFSGNVFVSGATGVFPATGRGLLEVNGTTNALLGLTIGNSAKAYFYHDGTNLGLKTYTGNITFDTSAGTALTIASTGAATFSSSVTAQSLDVISSSGVGSSGASGLARFITAGTTTAVSIGQSNSARKLDIGSQSLKVTGDDFYIVNASSNATIFENNGAERLKITSGGNVQPGTDNAYSLGVSGTRWSAVWAANGTIQTSDEREKKDIVNSDLGLDFISKLRPVSFKWKVGLNKVTSEKVIDEEGNLILDEEGNETNESVITPIEGKRTHYGLIAQEVKEALGDVDFGGFIHDSETDIMGLRYDQFIPLLIKSIQELKAEIDLLKGEPILPTDNNLE